VAIVQVSRITNRKGLAEDLPQLAGAELGWCLDSRQLFIGNGTLQDGAPVVGNTEILTEFSDIVAVSQYTYSDIAVGYAAQTGTSPGDPVVRTVQEKLDDFANVRDFGAVGNGATDDTAAIMQALNNLYCVEVNSQIRRTLYFPAGTYLVSDSIVIPTYAKLVGEGADCTIILLDTQGDSAVPDYVALYGDSLQQTGANIGNNGATPPRNIEISSMTFQSVPITDVFLVEDATQCYFDSVNFQGPFISSDITAPGFLPAGADNIAGVRFNSTTVNICNQITFDKCQFTGLAYGINTDEQIQSITVSNSKFDTLYQGIVLCETTAINGGATGFRAIGNMFDTIYAEGIIYGQASLNISAYNVFYNVGYNIGSSNPITVIIKFSNVNNVSLNDMFDRSDADANQVARIQVLPVGTPTGGTQLQLGTYARENGQAATLVNNSSNQPILTFNSDQVVAVSINYTITRSTAVRHGVLTVSVGATATYSDDFTESAATGVTLAISQSTNQVSVIYTTTNTGIDGSITYSLSHLA
jgi:hypothetical protein